MKQTRTEKTFFYNVQLLFDVCVYIFENRNKSYNELFNDIKQYFNMDVKRFYRLVIIYGDDVNFKSLIKDASTIIEYLKNKKNNTLTNEIISEFKKLNSKKLVHEEVQVEERKPSKAINMTSRYNPECLANNKELQDEIIQRLFNGETEEELAESISMSLSCFRVILIGLFLKNPELWVKYKTYKSSAEIIKDDELEQYKCVLEYFIKNIEQAILTLKGTYVKGVACRNQMVYLKKILNQYKKCLETLNFEHSTPNNSIPDVEDFIKDYVLNINELLKIYNSLGNSNNITEKNKKESKKLFKKQYNLLNKIK